MAAVHEHALSVGEEGDGLSDAHARSFPRHAPRVLRPLPRLGIQRVHLLERPVALADAPKEDAQSRDLGCERGALEYLIGVASLETVPTVALPHVRRRQMRKGR